MGVGETDVGYVINNSVAGFTNREDLLIADDIAVPGGWVGEENESRGKSEQGISFGGSRESEAKVLAIAGITFVFSFQNIKRFFFGGNGDVSQEVKDCLTGTRGDITVGKDRKIGKLIMKVIEISLDDGEMIIIQAGVD